MRPSSSTWASSAESGYAPNGVVPSAEAAPAADGVATVASGVGPMDKSPLMTSGEFLSSSTPAPPCAAVPLSAFAAVPYPIPMRFMPSLLNMAAE